MHRRHMGTGLLVAPRREQIPLRQLRVSFRIPLFHKAKAAKLPLLPIKVAVTIAVQADKPIPRHVVDRLHPLHHMHRKRQPRNPGSSCCSILQIKLGRSRILQLRLRPQVIHHRRHQVGLLASHQVDIPHRLPALPRQRRRPHQTGRTIPQQIDRLHRCQIVHRGELSQRRFPRQGSILAEPIARLIQPDGDLLPPQVENIRRPRTIYIRQPHPLLVKHLRMVKPGSPRHRHPGPKPAIAQTGPVAHLPIANPHQVI